MNQEINFAATTEPRLLELSLAPLLDDQQVIDYGAIMVCRHGTARIRINFKGWNLFEGAVLTLFPGDVVSLSDESDCCVEMLQYDATMLREASLQLEHTVYERLRKDRCRQDSPVVTDIINRMFGLLRVYFDQHGCTCVAQLTLLQLKAFFIGFHEYLQRNPMTRQDEPFSPRVRQLFNEFIMLVERDFRLSRDVAYYASQMNITPKYLTMIVQKVTSQTPKRIIDHYPILQLRLQLKRGGQSIKQLAWEYHFSDVSFFCRYFKRHTGFSPVEMRRAGVLGT